VLRSSGCIAIIGSWVLVGVGAAPSEDHVLNEHV